MNEVMAELHWSFTHEFGQTLIEGKLEMRTLSKANALRDSMNVIYGDGSHWVEPLNETYEERHGTSDSVSE